MRRFRFRSAGLMLSLSLMLSALTFGNVVNAKTVDNTKSDEKIILEDEIEEQEIVSKYDAVTNDALVSTYITDHYLLDFLTNTYNAKVAESNVATIDTLTYGQLQQIIPSGDTDTIDITGTEVTKIKSIEGLGLLRNAAGGLDISALTGVTEIPAEEFENGSIKRFIMPSTIKTIGEKAFAGCTKLEGIKLPSTLEVLGTASFANCESLNTISSGETLNKLPSTLKTVGQQVFTNDSSITDIIIPKFDDDAEGKRLEFSTGLFYGCTGLVNITISDGITIIPESAFARAGSGSTVGAYITFPKSLVRIKSAAFANVVFSTGTGGGEATKTLDFSNMGSLSDIDSEAFMGIKNIENVILPNVTSLSFGDYAFAQTSISKMYVKGDDSEEGLIYLPDSVKSIGAGCFFGNESMKKLSLSPNLSLIPDNAFDGCTNLGDIKQRQDSNNCKVTLIGDAAFRGTAIADTEFLMKMNNLTQIGRQIIESGYTFKKGVGISNKDVSSQTEVASIPLGGQKSTDFKIDDTGKKTFKNKACGSEVFTGCKNLKSVHIPASVNKIATRAFYYCIGASDKAQSIITSIVWESDDKASVGVNRIIYSGAFHGNSKVSSITLPYRAGDTMEIGAFAFANNINLNKLKFGDGENGVFPNTVTKISSGAFYHCESLESVTVQDTASGSCPELQNMIFWGCTGLKTAVYPASITVIPDHEFYDAPLESFVIGAGGADSGKNVTKIDTLAFFGNKFTTVDLSGFVSLGEIGAGAYSYFDMVLENSFEGKDAKLGWASEDKACKLKEMILPDALSTSGTLFINTAVFSGQKLFDTMKTASRGTDKEIYIPNYMSVSNGRALFAATGVKKTVWQRDIDNTGNEWTDMPPLMYYACENIVNAEDVLPTGNYVTGIGQGVFEACSIKSANLSAYEHLEKLGTGSAGSNWVPNNPGVFHGCSSLTKVILPDSDSEEFIADKNCFTLCTALNEVDLGTVTELGEKAFQYDISLSTIVFPERLKTIGNYAFSECLSFNMTKDNNFPSSLVKIGNNAFEKDISLSQVAFKSNLTDIGNSAFIDCTGLKTADFSSATALTKIGSSSFQNTGLEDFKVINSKVETIEGSVLKGCQNLKTVEFGASVTSIKADAICGCPEFKSLSVAPTTVIDRGIFKSSFGVQETTIDDKGKEVTKTVQKYTAEKNDYSVAVLVNSPAEQTLPLGREFDLPFYINPKGTSAITSILIGEGSTDSSIQEMLKVSAKSADGYFWGTTKDTDGTHRITSEEYYEPLETSKVNKYNNTDVDVITIQTLKPGKYDLLVSCGITFDCAKKEKDSNGNDVTYSIKASNVTVKFKYNVEEMKFHPVMYTKYSSNTYADEDKVATDKDIVIQATGRNSRGSTRYYYNMVSDENKPESISTYDIVAISDNPEVVEVSNSSSAAYPEGGYKTTNCTKVDASTRAVSPQNNNMYFYINPKKVGKAKVTIIANGYGDKPDYQTVMSFDVKADIDSLSLAVPEEYKNGAAVGAKFNVFSEYKNVLGQVVNGDNPQDKSAFSNNTISYESNYPEYVSVDAEGNVSVLKADKRNKSVRITAKTVDAASAKSANCSITVLGTDNGSSSGGNGSSGNNNDNKDTTPANPDGTYDDTSSKANVTVDPATGEAAYIRPTAEADTTSVNIPSTVRINGTTYKVTSFDPASFAGNTAVTRISVGSNVTSIPNGAFAGCTALTSVLIPSSVMTIGNDAFAGCAALTSVSIPSKVVVIGDNAFNGCTALKSISIPSSVTSIGANTFVNCKSLTSVSIPSSVTSIGANAFKGCTSMTNASIGDGVTSIGANAFNGCTKLANVNIPDNAKLTTIGNSAFQNCKVLTTVTIPKKVKTIGAKAFYNCKKLKTINVKSTSLKKIGKQAFKGIYKKAVINVPKKKYKKYKKLFKGKGQKKTVKMKKVY